MNIWILQTGEPLHIDNDDHRPMRAINLANSFLEKGNNVTIWSSTFYHQKKKHRFNKNKFIKINKNFSINLINSPGYKKNIGFGRLYDHFVLSIKLLKELMVLEGDKPDFVFIGYPPIEIGFVLSIWLKIKDIPFILDVKDQWPDLFADPFSEKIKPLIKILLIPYYLMAKYLFKTSNGFSSMSESYLNWCYRKANRKKNNFDYLLPLSSPELTLTKKEILRSEEWWAKNYLQLKENKYFCFVGTISRGFDFYEISLAMKKIEKHFPNIKLIIAGDGEELNRVKTFFNNSKNTIFSGWINSINATTLINNSVLTVAPYKNINNFKDNIPNKIIDSFKCSKPVITSLSGETKNIIERYETGIICLNKSQEWYEKFVFALENLNKIEIMGKDSYKLYKNKFDFKKTYDEFVDFVERKILKNER